MTACGGGRGRLVVSVDGGWQAGAGNGVRLVAAEDGGGARAAAEDGGELRASSEAVGGKRRRWAAEDVKWRVTAGASEEFGRMCAAGDGG
ncbi:hypothetical protein PF008_g8028 [Phytophthora fragariae]|uniref:Uncharacterized protein n=1 Tax=Phytophthora fragariae TaxID=53985 RepID=A0A6G0S0Q9_9STRA|nr:hypothetical protein PF008_g8028 [Phytophthora fragariae]